MKDDSNISKTHYENLSLQYTEFFFFFFFFFSVKLGKFVLFLLKTLIAGTSVNRRTGAVLISTHNLCFGPKIIKIGIPLYSPAYPSFTI